MAPRPALVSVVVPARNAAATVADQLDALSRQTYRGHWEVIVVDNASADGTAVIAERWRAWLPKLKVVNASEARGAGYARNVGVELSSGELVLFCDADDVVDDGWLAAMTQALQSSPTVGGSIEREALNDAAAIAARPGSPGSMHNTLGFLPFPLTANCGLRKYVWSALGGFSLRFAYGSDDVDFFWRAQLLGYECAYVPDSVVYYRLRASDRARARQIFEYGRSHPRLFRMFEDHGMPRTPLANVLCEWWWLASHPHDLLRSPERRAVWITKCSLRLGRFVGSLQNRIVYL